MHYSFWLKYYYGAWGLRKKLNRYSIPTVQKIFLILATVLLWCLQLGKNLNRYSISTEKNIFVSGYSTTMVHQTYKIFNQHSNLA